MIKITTYHTVIKPSDLVGASAVEALKGLVGGQDIDLPSAEVREMLAHLAVKLLRLGHIRKQVAKTLFSLGVGKKKGKGFYNFYTYGVNGQQDIVLSALNR